MSLFRWFSRGSRQDGGTQAPRHEDESGARQTQRRERSARREQLYVIVREAMVRVGILSAGYKFKVLSLDSSGQRFVVMVDLAPAYAADASQQRSIEALIAELARTRMEAGVHAVYWRVNGQIQAAAPATNFARAVDRGVLVVRRTTAETAALQFAVGQCASGAAGCRWFVGFIFLYYFYKIQFLCAESDKSESNKSYKIHTHKLHKIVCTAR